MDYIELEPIGITEFFIMATGTTLKGHVLSGLNKIFQSSEIIKFSWDKRGNSLVLIKRRIK